MDKIFDSLDIDSDKIEFLDKEYSIGRNKE